MTYKMNDLRGKVAILTGKDLGRRSLPDAAGLGNLVRWRCA